jgi:MFS family permease
VNALRERLGAALGGLPSTFWTLWAGMLVNRLASFVITFLGLYLVRERGFTAAAAGQVVALYGAGLLVAGPLGGTLADRIGRRVTMLIGLGAGGACVAALAFIRAPAALAGMAFLAALAGETYRPAANAAIADLVAPPDRPRAYGLVYWAVNLGWTLSLAIAGFVAERSIRLLFLADATTSILFAAIVLARVPETRPPLRAATPVLAGMGRVLSDRPYTSFLALHLVALMVFVQFQLAAPLDYAAHGVGPVGFSLLMAMNGLGVVLLQPLTSRFVARADGARLLAASALLFGVGMGLNSFQGSVPAYALGNATWTVGEVLGFPVAAALVADLAPPDLRGRYQGAFSMTWGLAFTVAPILGGATLERFGGRALWLACLAAGALVAAGHLLAAPSRRRRLARIATGPSPAPPAAL